MENNKSKIKIILIVFLVIILIGIGSYYLFFAKGNVDDTAQTEEQTPVTFTIGNEDIDLNQKPSSQNENTQISLSGETTVTGKGAIPKLRKISQSAVAGMTSQNVTEGKDTKTVVWFIERATGHVFEMKADSWIQERISNTTIPKMYDVVWGKNQNSFYVRRILDGTEEIETYFVTLKPVTTPKISPIGAQEIGDTDTGTTTPEGNFIVEGTYLPKNIEDLAVGNDGKKIFYLIEKNSGGSGMLSDLNGTKGSEVWSSPLHEFLVSWPKTDTVTLNTKPSASTDGFLYFLNTSTQKTQKIIGGNSGLTSLTAPNALFVLYGVSIDEGYSLKTYDVKNKNIEPVSLVTLPEKCIWSKKNLSIVYCAVPSSMPRGSYPDSWYQGITSFNDEIWQINFETKANKLLAKPEELGGESIDGTKLSLSPDEDYLFLINKKDNFLWSLRLVEQTATSTASGE